MPDLLWIAMKGLCNRLQHVDKGWPAVARGLGKISAAPKWLALGRQKHRQGPAALLAKSVKRRHIDMIDVGTLLPVDLDVHEMLVHHRCGRYVLKTFMRHHVAPVAGGIPDREQYRLIECLGFAQRLRPPHPPMHGV